MRRKLALLAVLILALAALPAAALEIATACRAKNLRLAGSGDTVLLIWETGGDAKKGCKGETRAAWLEGDQASELPEDFLGPGFRAPGSGAKATALPGGKLLVVWAAEGNIEGALVGPGEEKPEKRFPISPADLPSDVAAPLPLAGGSAGKGDFLVIYESDFFSGRRRNPVWRAFGADGEAKGEIQPACADFVTVRDPRGARLGSGSFAVAGPGIGPLGDSFFVQFLSSEGELLGEPRPGDEKNRVLGGDLAALAENYVFTWNIRAGKIQKAWIRQHAADGTNIGKPRELGPTAGPPALATSGAGVLVAWVEPTPERQVQLLKISKDVADGEIRIGPKVPEGVDEVALGGKGPRLAWAEATRIVVQDLTAGN